MIFNINDIIGIILLIIIIGTIICKNNTENFADDFNRNIIQQYGLHISAVRNMAQLAGTALVGDTLYLPINNINSKTVTVQKTNIQGDITISNNFELKKINNFETTVPVIFDLYPKFMVIPWGGDPTKLPSNWFICDGKGYIYKTQNTPSEYNPATDKAYNDTLIYVPDMRNKFVLNVNDQVYTPEQVITNTIPLRSHPFNQVGGTENEILASNNLPLHHHYFNLVTTNPTITYNQTKISSTDIDNKLLSGLNTKDPIDITPIGSEWYNGTIDLNGLKTPQHNIYIKNNIYNIINTLNSTQDQDIWNTTDGTFKFNDTTKSHENMPPYYKLCYIIKL